MRFREYKSGPVAQGNGRQDSQQRVWVLMCHPTLSPLGGDMNNTLSNLPQLMFCLLNYKAGFTYMHFYKFHCDYSSGMISHSQGYFQTIVTVESYLLCGSGDAQMCFLKYVYIHICIGWYWGYSVHSFS